ncbi:MAG: nicotinate-nucleotide adenylyltransferase [Clostridia bacterium]|nr:nicotinate-nucleotide adenylyltransferase [Clostridia bacterium]
MRRGEGYRLGVLGGSFNPVHNAHLAMARAAMEAFGLERVLFLPTGNPPHKRAGLADKRHRLRMVELAVDGCPGFAACDLEVRREGTTYTVDTLHILRARWPGASLWYIVGADTLLELHTWRKIDAVLTMCAFVVCARPGWQEEAVEECASRFRERGAAMHPLYMPGMDISSTMIRRSLERGERTAEALVPPAAWRYLLEHRLYGPEAGGTPPPNSSPAT